MILDWSPELIDITPKEYLNAARDPDHVRTRRVRGCNLSIMTVMDLDEILLTLEIDEDAPIIGSIIPDEIVEFLREVTRESGLRYPPMMPTSQEDGE